MSTGNLNKNSQSSKKNMRFEHELIEEIENHKDPLIPFAAWVKQACREKLEREKMIEGTVAPKRAQVNTVADNKTAKNAPKPRYMWHTPVGSFDNRTEAEKATGLKTYTLTKKCDNHIDGFSREII